MNVNITPERPSQLSSTFNNCPQCGLIHPPIPEGQRCPNAPIQTTEKKIDLTNFFGSLSNILSSQLVAKGIKNHDKFFGYLIIENMKLIENYKE